MEMAIDGLAVATEIGSGEAQIFDTTNKRPLDYANEVVSSRRNEAKRREAEAKKQQDDMEAVLKEHRDIKLEGYIADDIQLNSDKKNLELYVLEQYKKNPNYQPQYDKDFIIKRNSLGEDNDFSKNTKKWDETIRGKLVDPQKYTLDSHKKVNDFRRMPLKERKEYVTKYGAPPDLEAIKKSFDIEKQLMEIAPKPEVSGSEVKNPDGTSNKNRSTTLNPVELKEKAERLITILKDVDWVVDLREKTEENYKAKHPDYVLLTPEEYVKAINDEMKATAIKTWQSSVQTGNEQSLEGSDNTKGTYALNNGIYANGKWNFSFDKDKIRMQNVDATENKEMYFTDPTTKKQTKGIPINIVWTGSGPYVEFITKRKEPISTGIDQGKEKEVEETRRIKLDDVKRDMETLFGTTIDDIKEKLNVSGGGNSKVVNEKGGSSAAPSNKKVIKGF